MVRIRYRRSYSSTIIDFLPIFYLRFISNIILKLFITAGLSTVERDHRFDSLKNREETLGPKRRAAAYSLIYGN